MTIVPIGNLLSIMAQTLPEIPGYDFGAGIVPARAVDGDFYDVFPLNDDQVAVFISDLADKGVPSAIFMARVHALLVAEAGHCRRAAYALKKVSRNLIINFPQNTCQPIQKRLK